MEARVTMTSRREGVDVARPAAGIQAIALKCSYSLMRIIPEYGVERG